MNRRQSYLGIACHSTGSSRCLPPDISDERKRASVDLTSSNLDNDETVSRELMVNSVAKEWKMNGRHEIEKHPILGDLDVYAGFYEALSTSVFQWVTGGTHALTNLDTYLFSALQGTLSSIRLILAEGRINDAYTLLRKYHDLAVANLYTNIFLKENFSADNFIVQQIDDWRSGKAKLPEYRVMNQYVRAASCLSPVTDLLFADDRYKQLRERCNDHTHYNYYRSMLFNECQSLPARQNGVG